MINALIVILTILTFTVIVLSVLFWTASVLYRALVEDDGSIHDLGDGENFARRTGSNRNN